MDTALVDGLLNRLVAGDRHALLVLADYFEEQSDRAAECCRWAFKFGKGPYFSRNIWDGYPFLWKTTKEYPLNLKDEEAREGLIDEVLLSRLPNPFVNQKGILSSWYPTAKGAWQAMFVAWRELPPETWIHESGRLVTLPKSV